MADVARTLAALQTLFADNTAGDISAQDLRDFLVSAYQPQAVNGFRLTLESGVPISTTDQTAKTNVYLTPYLHNCIGVYDGSSWKQYTSSELTLALGTLTSGKNYDVFLYDNAGTLTLESLVWTNDTTRATAIVLQDGVYCKSGALTRRYIGTFRTTSTTTTEDSAGGTTTQVGGKRFLWNAYNRVPRFLAVIDTSDSWTYDTTSYRAANANNGNRVEFVRGLNLEPVRMLLTVIMTHSVGVIVGIGIGLDTTTANSARQHGGGNYIYANPIPALYEDMPTLGYHYLQWVERGGVSGGATFYGDVGITYAQSGMSGILWG